MKPNPFVSWPYTYLSPFGHVDSTSIVCAMKLMICGGGVVVGKQLILAVVVAAVAAAAAAAYSFKVSWCAREILTVRRPAHPLPLLGVQRSARYGERFEGISS